MERIAQDERLVKSWGKWRWGKRKRLVMDECEPWMNLKSRLVRLPGMGCACHLSKNGPGRPLQPQSFCQDHVIPIYFNRLTEPFECSRVFQAKNVLLGPFQSEIICHHHDAALGSVQTLLGVYQPEYAQAERAMTRHR